MLALTTAGCALLIAPLLGGTVAARLFPQPTDSSVIWLAGALCTGAALVASRAGAVWRYAPMLAVAGGAMVISRVLVVVPNRVFAQQMEWKDPSPHKTTLVTVEDGVQLEVLDWGGSGPALVLLAGLGATAHHYDDFAPALTARLPRGGCDTARPSGIVSGPRRLRIRAPG